MAWRLRSGTVNTVPFGAGAAISAGESVYQASNEVIKTDGSSETTATIVGVAMNAAADANATIDVILFNDDQVWEIDCTNNTSASQRLENHIMTNGATVANSDTEAASTAAIVRMIEDVGAASDKKALFRVNYIGSTAI